MDEKLQGAPRPRADELASEPCEGPLLSIGLPVYNGAKHLRQSMDSLLSQDVRDFELVISDNASTDETQSICLEYASQDSRIRYTRTDSNIGAAANFNRVFRLCSGRYFMWGSDDDVWDSRFARLCIEKLERSPHVIMCTSQVVFIRDDDSVVSDFSYKSVDTEHMPVEAKFHELTRQSGWFGTYSVYRPNALRATRLFLPTFGMDVRLQLELLMLGDSAVVPEALFCYRFPDVGKTAMEYVAEIGEERSSDETREELRDPYSYLARELLSVARESNLCRANIHFIEDQLVDTLGFENLVWRDHVFREQELLPEVPLMASTVRLVLRRALQLDKSTGTRMDMRQMDGWRMRDGMRFGSIRRGLLRLLQPFTEPQDTLNLRHEEAIARLNHEIAQLQSRIRHLERRESPASARFER